MGNAQATSLSNTEGKSNRHHQGHETLSKTMTRGKNLIKFGRKRHSLAVADLRRGSNNSNEDTFSNIFSQDTFKHEDNQGFNKILDVDDNLQGKYSILRILLVIG